MINFTDGELTEIVKTSKSLRECAKKMQVVHHNRAKKILLKNNIDISSLTFNPVGKQYGDLKITSMESIGKRRYAICVCRCGNVCRKRLDALIGGKTIACSQACTKKINNTVLFGERNPAYRGLNGVPRELFFSIKRGAVRRKIEINVSFEYIADLALKQGHKCIFSGVDLIFPIRSSRGNASLDRIDSSIGYVEGNLQWTHKYLNIMKGVLENEDFIKMCCLVAKHQSSKIEDKK